MTYRKKLIEVALPLDAINAESAREKSIRHGHPSTLHLWWSRKPLATCRAVLYASLVDDPSDCPHFKAEFEAAQGHAPSQDDEDRERERIFTELEALVKWENSSNETVLEPARARIRRCCDGNPPPVLDPFCGGGSIPLEAQRLGLEAHASDLNPVAVLITKALIEIPPRFAGKPPVNPTDRRTGMGAVWKGASGLAADVRYYGKWLRDEAERRIGHLYPKAKLPDGGEATVIAWLWARTVRCPNPACGAQMPLTSKWTLSTKPGKETYAFPNVSRDEKIVRFEIRHGKDAPDGTVDRRGARCLVCGAMSPLAHVRAEGMAGRMDAQLMAVVAEGYRARIYVPPDEIAIPALTSSENARTERAREQELSGATPERLTGGTCYGYGLTTWGSLFTPRQLVTLTTISDLVGEVRDRVCGDAATALKSDASVPPTERDTGSKAYGDAVSTYLAFLLSKGANAWSTVCSWDSHKANEKVRNTFSRQAIPMTWDFAEGNPFSNSSGSMDTSLEFIFTGFNEIVQGVHGYAESADAITGSDRSDMMVSTDPPYYDNIGYADLSDFFYVWLRPVLRTIYPDLFSTVLVSKSTELVAAPYRFNGDKLKARQFFENGFIRSMSAIHNQQTHSAPLTVYYAFKQAESNRDRTGEDAISSTGWETMLTGLLSSGFQISGTWPVRSESGVRLNTQNSNALASSIVIVCRPRLENAPLATRREFQRALRADLPVELRVLTSGRVAPVDLAQAVIGPGMAVFSRYSKVIEADGNPMSVRTALQLINQALDAYFTEQEGDLDPDTRFCLAWFEQYGMDGGAYGAAETLSRAKNIDIASLNRRGLLTATGGKVGLIRGKAFLAAFEPASAGVVSVWEACQRLVAVLSDPHGGEAAAAALVRRLGAIAEQARVLAYRLYVIADRKGWTEEALGYNVLVASWPAIVDRAAQLAGEQQGTLV